VQVSAQRACSGQSALCARLSSRIKVQFDCHPMGFLLWAFEPAIQTD
jgi:hypothetical protein